MAAGIETKRWTPEDLLALTDGFVATRKFNKRVKIERAERRYAKVRGRRPVPETIVVDMAEVAPAPSHYNYVSFLHSSVKTHAAGCANCRDGRGRGGAKPGTAKWVPFYSLEAALRDAEATAPGRSSICSMCLGEYRKRGYRDPR